MNEYNDWETYDDFIAFKNRLMESIRSRKQESMSTKLEKMIELWDDKFKPHIDEYEDMYYVLFPDAEKPEGAKTDSSLFNAANISTLFKKTDAAYKEGYTTAVITKLQYEEYNKRIPAIRMTIFYTKDEVPEDEE